MFYLEQTIVFSHLQNRKFVIEVQDNPEPLVFYTSSHKRLVFQLQSD